MGKIFDVDNAPGSELKILELDAPTLSDLVGRDFIINRVRGADEIFVACDVVRIQIHHVQGGLQLILLIERQQQAVYSVPLSVVAHAGFDLWLAGSDGEGRDVVLFVKPDGLSPEGMPCARIRILVFTAADPRTRPSEYQYTETIDELPPPVPEPACDGAGMTKSSEDDESEGYTER